MFYIGMTNFTQKNRFGSVWTGTMDHKRLVLGGSVQFPWYFGQSWTGCGPWLRVLGAKNWTQLNLQTLSTRRGGNTNNFSWLSICQTLGLNYGLALRPWVVFPGKSLSWCRGLWNAFLPLESTIINMKSYSLPSYILCPDFPQQYLVDIKSNLLKLGVVKMLLGYKGQQYYFTLYRK